MKHLRRGSLLLASSTLLVAVACADDGSLAEKPIGHVDAGTGGGGGTGGTTTDGSTPWCSPGETRSCYSGPAQTQGVGRCQDGSQSCQTGTFGPCEGEVLPASSEQCDGSVDDNCDGLVDEGCACQSGETRPCYTGPTATQGTGPCAAGVQQCQGGQWASACTGQTLPAAESCNGVDDDCNGAVDDNTGLRLYHYSFLTTAWSNGGYLSNVWTGPNAPGCAGIAAAVKLTDIDRTLVFGSNGTLYWRKGSVWQPPQPITTRFPALTGAIDSLYHIAYSWSLAWNPSAPMQEGLTFTSVPNFHIYQYLPNDTVTFSQSGTLTNDPPPAPNQSTVRVRWVFEKLDLALLGSGAAYEFFTEYEDGFFYRYNAAGEWTKWSAQQSPLFSKAGAPAVQSCTAALFDHGTRVATLLCP